MSNSRFGATRPRARASEVSYPRMEWERVDVVERGNVVVTISCLPLRFPRYAIEIGVRLSPEKVGRFFNLRVNDSADAGEGADGAEHGVSLERLDKQALLEAVAEAEDRILALAIADKKEA